MTEPTVVLRPMTDDEFADWRERSIAGYADDLARVGAVEPEVALDRARQQFAQLLPDGLHTQDTWLNAACTPDGERVGTLWLGQHPNRADMLYVYDIEIDEQHRRKGYGRATMLAAEPVARDAGRSGIGLNVFGFNHGAQELYRSLGYEVVATTMRKDLSGP